MKHNDVDPLEMQSATQHVRTGSSEPTTAIAVICVETGAPEDASGCEKRLWEHVKSDELWTDLSFVDVSGQTLVAGLDKFGAAYLFCDALRTRLAAEGLHCVATIFVDVWTCIVERAVPQHIVDAAMVAVGLLDALRVREKSNGPLLQSNRYPLVFVTPHWYTPPSELRTSLASAADIQMPGVAERTGVWLESRPSDDHGKSVSERIVDTHGRVIKGVLTIYWENRR